MARFDGKVAVVTGAGQGVGRSTAIQFAAEGAKVILVGRTESKLVKVQQEIGKNAYVYTMDVGLEESWKGLIAYIKKEFGEIDYLVNNAAVVLAKDILNLTFEEFKMEQSCDLDSVFLGMKYGYEVLKKGCYSAIVNVSSIGGLKSGPDTGNDAGYNAAKAGVTNLTRHAACVFAKDCIRVNSVHPGAIRTKMLEDYLKMFPEAMATTAINSPLPPHWSEPENIAECILFLCDIKSKSVTGTQLVSDCGCMAI